MAKKPTVSAEIKQLLSVQRAQLMGVIELRGVRRLRKSYDQARGELLAKLKGLGGAETFTAHHLRRVLLQVEDGIKVFERVLDKNLKDAGRIAQVLAPRHTVQAAQKMEKRFRGHVPVLQVEQAGVLRGIFEKVQPTLLERYSRSLKLYGRPVVERVKMGLAQSLLQAETVDEAVDRVDDVIGMERWRAERIVRTELSYSYGITQQASMEQMRADLPGMQKKLVATFDDRTGEDSKELHGQIRDVDKPFTWEKKTKAGVEIVEYMMPPNRPNDREVVIPWMPGWDEVPVLEEGGKGPGAVTPRQPPPAVVEEAAEDT